MDTRALGAELKKLSIDLVDSPITQEASHAIDQAGATLMVGSDSQSALGKAMPLLKTVSRHIFVIGSLGSGHVMKTLNNYVSVGSILALCDALVAGKFSLGAAGFPITDCPIRSEAGARSSANDRCSERRNGQELQYGIQHER